MIPAMAYASLGWHVVPILRGDKRPTTRNGVYDATDDPAKICEWFYASPPDLNIGIRTGAASGILVLDIDGRNSGFETLAALASKHGPLPKTPRAQTGSGNGEHYVFACPPVGHFKGKLGPGIDVLGEGRLFVAFPSIHPSGGVYDWLVTPWSCRPAPAPDWLLKRITIECRVPVCDDAQPANDPSIIDRARRYLDHVAPAISGKGGSSHTFIVASRLVLGFGLSVAEALPLLQTWNNRCLPPWSDRELKRKLHDAARNGRMEPGCMLR